MSLPTVYKIDDADRRNISQLKAAIGAEGVEVGEKWLSGAVSATLEDFFWTPDNYRNHIITFLAMYRLAPTGFFRPMIRSFTGITREKFVEAAKANGSPYYTTGSVYKFAALLEELVNPGSKIALDLVEALFDRENLSTVAGRWPASFSQRTEEGTAHAIEPPHNGALWQTTWTRLVQPPLARRVLGLMRYFCGDHDW